MIQQYLCRTERAVATTVLCTSLFLSFGGFSPLARAAEIQQQPETIGPRENDSERVAYLTENGVRVEVGRVVVWLPPDTLSSAERRSLVERLSRGLEAVEGFTYGPRRWQRFRRPRVEYYFHPSRFGSHANPDGWVFIPFELLQDGRAPILHETTHALLNPPAPYLPEEYADEEEARAAYASWPLWLTEGLTDYIAKTVSAQTGIPEGDVFDLGSADEMDSGCARMLSLPAGAEVMPFIGAPGAPDSLRQRRREVAPIFYGCAASFSKFLVGLLGIEPIVDLIPEPDPHGKLEELTGMSIEMLRSSWLEHIGADR